MRNPNEEGVEDQLDRLNLALHEMLNSVRCETPTQRSVSRMSVVPPDLWNEEIFSNHSGLGETDDLHEQLDLVLQENDRLQMRIEDFLSAAPRNQGNNTLSVFEIDQLIEVLNSVKSGKSQEFTLLSQTFTLNTTNTDFSIKYPSKLTDLEIIQKLEKELEELRKTESSSNFSNSIDNEETCPVCNINPNKLGKEIKLELSTEFLKIKNEAIERERSNFEAQFEELDDLKSNYLKKTKDLQAQMKNFNQRKVELEKKELEFASRKSQFEKKKHDWEHKVVNYQNDLNPSEEVYSPGKFSQEELENHLKDLKNKVQESPDSKLSMRINQIETQLTKMRTEKLLRECSKKNTKLVTNLVKTFDKETTQDENKRKRLLDRTHLTLMSVNSALKKEEKKVPVDRKYELLLLKEKELNEKEKYLQDTWKKVPSAEEVVNVIQETYKYLNQSKTENQRQVLMIDQERTNLKKVFEKFLECVESFENTKGYNREAFEKIKQFLSG